MRIKRFLAFLLAMALCLGASCALADSYDMPYYIEVDITNQIVTIYNTADNSIVRQMLTSSGMNDCTPNGTFYLTEKGRLSERGEWTWFQQYQCWVKYATRIHLGYMFHSLPFAEKDESTMIQQMVDEFGLPTSHGCMRLRVDDARFIAKECLQGTRVRIYKSDTKDEALRQLLLISSYTGEGGMSYAEFLGYSEDALGRGAAGTEVSDLQYRLADLGYFGGEPNGSYDTDTIAAVKHVQQDLGLAQNGIATVELLDVLYSDEAPVSAGRTTLKEGRSGPVVKKLQAALNAIGLYNGDMDSVYDLEVSEAVRLFQGACGYPVDGIATAEMQQALYHQLAQLEEKFGAGNIPAGEFVTEEVNMARLDSENNIIIRSEPNTDSQNLGKLRDGDIMMVNATKDGWASITVEGLNGYVMTKYLDGFTQNNVILQFTGSDGTVHNIGHTMAEYAAGARKYADEFAAYYTSEQFASSADETVDYVTVNTGSDDVKLNLRAQADSGAEILAEVPNGTSLRVLSKDEGWTKVGFDEQIGFLMNDYLSFWQGSVDDVESTEQADEDVYGAEALMQEGVQTINAVVVCVDEDGKAGVYELPDAQSVSLGRLPAGAQVQVVQLKAGEKWALIEYEGKQGYMQDANLQFQLVN